MKRALCPECGKPMTYNRRLEVWDCGPPDEGGHGFWDPELQTLEYEEVNPSR